MPSGAALVGLTAHPAPASLVVHAEVPAAVVGAAVAAVTAAAEAEAASTLIAAHGSSLC